MNRRRHDGPERDLGRMPGGRGPAGADRQRSPRRCATSTFKGRVQMIEWPRTRRHRGFERREVADVESSGLTLAEASGVAEHHRSVRDHERSPPVVTDNGAMNGADTIRRTKSATCDVVINRPPDANQPDGEHERGHERPVHAEHVSNPDGGETLAYTITNPPDHGDLTGMAPSLTYDPDPRLLRHRHFRLHGDRRPRRQRLGRR